MDEFENPKELTAKTVCYWSTTFKDLVVLEETGVAKTSAIRAKAKTFLDNGCVQYDKELKCYICLPLKNYNSTTYHLRNNYAFKSGFECDCQFHNKVVSKNPEIGLMCSHALALKLQLKIWNWNRKQEKLNTSAELI